MIRQSPRWLECLGCRLLPASTEALLVIDMYEHWYQMDSGAATARYIDAFFRNVNWERVIARMESIG